jgi:hypothetical protein
MSNAGGMATVTRYTDMLAGNTTWNPWEPQGAYDALSTVTVPSGGVASITFAAIPQGYKHLQIRALHLTNNAASVSTMYFNGDTTNSNYRNHLLYSFGTSALGGNNAVPYAPVIQGGTLSAPGAMILDILDYANTTKNKTTRDLVGYDANGSGGIALNSNLWMNTAAITSITFNANTTFQQHSQFTLYGVK